MTGWIEEHAVRLDPVTYEPDAKDAAWLALFDAALGAAEVVFLGETNHFVHEKADFRLWWLRRLAGQRPLVVGEELSWSDGHHVWRYLGTGDPAHLDQAATFGGTSHRRVDRDDQPTGVFKASHDAYPTALFKAEQTHFYRGLRALPGIRRFFGFDIDAPGAGYPDVRRHAHHDLSFWRRLQRVRGESITDEAGRLEHALTMLPDDDCELRADLAATITSLRYTQMVNDAADYEAVRPAMAYREDVMKRHLDRELRLMDDGDVLVLIAHAAHLAKDDAGIGGHGVGPGGNLVPSLGHHLVHDLGLRPYSIWMIYGGGADSQPLPDLPNQATYPRDTLNALLGLQARPLVVPTAPAASGILAEPIGIGQMYNQVIPVHLPAQADAVFFLPSVSPLRAADVQ
jgi:erythromycin esterase-like protein